ncbi:MAG: alanine racemase [Gammaproteobacteria bacterium]|jgi:alanine racemase
MSGPVARINLAALRHNLARVREAAPGCKVITAIKADGYGHGMLQTARALEGADGWAVARVEEALTLRKAGFGKRIMVLEGFASLPELMLCRDSDLDLVIHDHSQLQLLGKRPDGKQPLRLWVKVDTGMHRVGIQPVEAPAIIEQLRQLHDVELVGVMTHFANADDRNSDYTNRQLETFAPFMDPAIEVSIANSAGILAWKGSHRGWVRPGIMLYGSSPFGDSTAAEEGLQPVMTLRTKLIAVRRLQKGDMIGYGSTFTCPVEMPVGVAAIGYGDGYPRHVPNGTPVLVNGERAAIAGRVSMDMITIDLRTIHNPRVGDKVVLWGEGLPAEEIAQAAGTITYELFCRLTSRVKFRYEE